MLNIKRDPRVCICVDDETPPFNYVQVEGRAELSSDRAGLKYWAKRIAGKYMGEDQAETYGARNSGEGELLVTVTPTKITGQKDVAG
jgi:PPOX class probable F420-dependent enzyme